MEFSTKALDWAKAGALAAKSDCLVIGLFESQTLAGAAKALDVATKGLVGRLVKLGDFEGKRGTSLLLHEVAGLGAARVLLVGLGKEADFADRAYAEAVRTALRALAGTKAANVTWALTEHTARDKDTAWAVLTAVTLIREASYRFIERHPELKSKRDKTKWGRDHAFTKRVADLMMERGFVGRVWDVIHFAPPLVTSKELVDRMVAIADESLTVAEKEFAVEIGD